MKGWNGRRCAHQKGLSTAWQYLLVHCTGSYCSGQCGVGGLSLSGVYSMPTGTITRLTSNRLYGQAFHVMRTWSRCSLSAINCSYEDISLPFSSAISCYSLLVVVNCWGYLMGRFVRLLILAFWGICPGNLCDSTMRILTN